LGLALWNKLDAGLLAIALLIAYLAILRRPPWRIITTSALVLSPWLLFSQLYFGSIIPYSATQKLTVVHPRALDHAWIWNSFRGQNLVWIAVLTGLSVLAVPLLRRASPPRALALAICVAWPLLHPGAFSMVALGDQYSWYRVVLYPPMALAAASLLGLIAQALCRRRTVINLVGLVAVL